MSVTSGDIKVYGSTYHRNNDTDQMVGGSINTGILMLFDNPTLANAPGGISGITVFSTAAADTTIVSITGRAAGGNIVGENITMAGTTWATGIQIFERILTIAAHQFGATPTHSGIVTVRENNSVLATMPVGVSYVRRPFYDVSADVAGGANRTYYEKVFVKNISSSYHLLGATISELTDIVGGGSISGTLDLIQNSYTTGLNRVTCLPLTGIGPVWNATMISGMPGADADLADGSGIGVWLALYLPAGTAANKSTYTLAVSGSTI